MTLTFPTFFGDSIEGGSPVCSLALHAFLVVISILVIGILFWVFLWLVLGSLANNPAIYVEGINMGWERQSL